MTTPQNPGWYDDPEQPEQLRYFDGVVWTSHTTPRTTRQPQAQPPYVAPQQPQQQSGPQDSPPLPQPPAYPPAYPPAGQYPPPGQQPPGYPPPGYPPAQWGYPQGGAAAYRQVGPTTEDGVPLAGYLQRVGAWIVDTIITSLLAYLAGLSYQLELLRAAQSASDELARGGDFTTFIDAVATETQRHLIPLTLISAAVAFAYHVFFVARYSATPGKLMVGISIRRVGQPGVVGWDIAARRRVLQLAMELLRIVQALAFLGQLVSLLDVLFPLWDKRRQALHDKVADTVVVRGRQPRG